MFLHIIIRRMRNVLQDSNRRRCCKDLWPGLCKPMNSEIKLKIMPKI
jgi:hypothetical protein